MNKWARTACAAAAAMTVSASGAVGAEDGELALLSGTPYDITFTDIADGVFIAQRPPFWRYPVIGNAVVVIGENSVAVYDGGGGRQFTDALLDEIRVRTNKPISHVILSHEHYDHVWAIDRLTRADPGVQFIAHPNAAENLREEFPGYIENRVANIDSFFETAKADLAANTENGVPMGPVERLYKRQMLADAPAILAEARRLSYDVPNVALTDTMTIDLGGRTIEVRHVGYGNTDGDLIAWLPTERILLIGDIVPHPTPFGFPGRPRESLRTMEALLDYNSETLVAGHGGVLKGDAYLRKVIAMYSGVNDEVERLHAQGLDAAAIRAAIDFDAIARDFADGDAVTQSFFRRWFVGPVVESSVAELTAAAD